MPHDTPGRAGSSTRQMARKRGRLALFLLVPLLIVAAVIALILRNPKAMATIGGMGTLALLVFFALFSNVIETLANRLFKARDRAIRGAVAEERIASLLAGLGESYLAIHDVPSPYGNIDHVVIGRDRGVFLLETKSHRGRVEVVNGAIRLNGKATEKDFVAQALRNAYWLRDEITHLTGVQAWITAIVVFTNAFVVPSPPIKGVIVTNQKYLLRELSRRTRNSPADARVWEARLALRARILGERDLRAARHAPGQPLPVAAPPTPAAAQVSPPEAARPGGPISASAPSLPAQVLEGDQCIEGGQEAGVAENQLKEQGPVPLVRCPQCGRQVSSHAISCPYCGHYPIRPAYSQVARQRGGHRVRPREPKSLNWEGGVLVVMAAAGFMYGRGTIPAVMLLAVLGMVLAVAMIVSKAWRQPWSLYRAILYGASFAVIGFILGFLLEWFLMHSLLHKPSGQFSITPTPTPTAKPW